MIIGGLPCLTISHGSGHSASARCQALQNLGLEPGARAGVELTLETAKQFCAALERAIAAAEFEKAEVMGGGFSEEAARDLPKLAMASEALAT